ncbi:MAG: pre-peptidase C-terminal domain-containing protein [Acetobacteraceae bacterium]|nr:pre-peptidase C-terminal domain-containing protein [Acetobacteraceae bacterium]
MQPPGPTGQNSPGTIADPSRGIVEFAGMVSAQHPLDVHEVHLTAGTQYTVGAFGDEHGFGTLHDPMLWVVDGSNRVVAYDDDTSPTDLDARATFTAPTTGTYYVAVMGYQGSSGTYELGMASTDQLSHSPSS